MYQNVSSIEQTGDREVTVTTAVPDSQFNLAMGGSAGRRRVGRDARQAKGADYGNSTGGVNCTGPFELTKWKSGESITLTRYDDYWDTNAQGAKPGEVTFLFMTDPTARINALKSGEVDGGWMIPIGCDRAARAPSTQGRHATSASTPPSSSLIVSDLTGPLGDLNVRKALLMALDRQGIVDAAAEGLRRRSRTRSRPTRCGRAPSKARSRAFDDLEEYPYDVKRRKHSSRRPARPARRSSSRRRRSAPTSP